jgi:hypothetical protein
LDQVGFGARPGATLIEVTQELEEEQPIKAAE